MTSSTTRSRPPLSGTTTKNAEALSTGWPRCGAMESQAPDQPGQRRPVSRPSTVARDMQRGLHGPSTGPSESLDADPRQPLLEALACLETADHYLRMLDGVIDTARRRLL